MGRISTTSLLTFEEFERLPDRPGKRELLAGELIELPPAELKHNRIAHRIYHLLLAAVEAAHVRGEAAEAGEVFHEMGYKLASNAYVQPDVSVNPRGTAGGKVLRSGTADRNRSGLPPQYGTHFGQKNRALLPVWRARGVATIPEYQACGGAGRDNITDRTG
jgi:hypothetical protein